MSAARWLWPSYAGAMVVCDLCGKTHEGDAPPLTWSLSMEGGEAKRFCDHCTRDHLRVMEGKLDVGGGW